jgi:LuxR family maltose regulon positive regulatory protein
MTDVRQAIDVELRDDLLATKLFPPFPRRDLVHRSRLTERLSSGLIAPLTVVVAPAGWGKTTLLSDWLASDHAAAPSVAWIALDEGDNDVVRFLRYLVGAVQTVDIRMGARARASLQSAQPPAAEAVLALLINDLAALSNDLVLVLDDYHVIDTPGIHQALTFLLDHLPPRLHLAIATRTEPQLPLARLRARGLLVELRAADLAFAADEAISFLNEVMGLRLTPAEITALRSRTEGWIAGLHLAALTLRERAPGDRQGFIAGLSGTHRYILDYLAGEVFALQPPHVQYFLLCTSILGGLSGPLCDAVLGDAALDSTGTDGQAMLEWLDSANLFVVRLDDTRTWYRYHHLFAGFLRERLRRERPDLIPDLHRRAARWLEESGRLEYAAEHALAAGRDPEAPTPLARSRLGFALERADGRY